jgi:DNA-binding beta-propeller fold protein YncE
VKLIRQFVCLSGILLLCNAYGDDKKSAAKKDSTSAAPAPTDLIWPLPPDPPRIRWLTEYSDLAKVQPSTRKSGWMEKLTGTKTLDEKLELRKPYGITTDSRGRIYVADTELKTVFVVDPAAKTVDRREGNSRASLELPAGVAIDAQDRLFVADAALHSILCFNPKGDLIATVGRTALGRPGGIAIDRARNLLYVADVKESRIAVFDTRSFEFLRYIGGPSKPEKPENGKFNAPTNVAVDRQGNLYVADTWNNRVQILDPSGTFIRAFGRQGDRPGEFIRPKGIAVDSEGHVYVADAEFNNFQIFTAEGQSLLAVGSLGTAPGQFALVAGIYIDSRNQIYTTEQYHGRVQVFQYLSQPESAQNKGVTKAATR